jgi:hypothetical protein
MKRTCRTIPAVLSAGVVVSLWLGAVAHGQGEVIVPVDPGSELSASDSHFIWEQPPLEIDALSKTPLFCGWDEPAYVEEIPNATESSTSRPVDDFRCPGPMPVTSIHWWGSYRDWQGPIVPAGGPDAWRITFSADTPASEVNPYSRPGTVLKEFEVGPGRVGVEWAGFDHFPDKPSDSCFRYSVALEPMEYFWPGDQEGDIFWIAIAAVYKTQKPEHVWGWKTRPAVWMDGAVETVSSFVVTPSGLPISAIFIAPVEGPNACGQTSKYDMTFALDTDPAWIKWEQPFGSLRTWSYYADEPSTARGLAASSIAYKWQQQPDLGSTGLDVDATVDSPATWPAQILADDFECALSGPVTQIDVWGSFYQDAPPGNDPNNVEFTLSIHANVPPLVRFGTNTPGKVLWTRAFKKGRFTVQPVTSERQGYFSPCNEEYAKSNHKQAWKYTFRIDPDEAFAQTGTSDKPVVYWLSVQGRVVQAANRTTRFGWKTAANPWGEDAVWARAEKPSSATWHMLTYPNDPAGVRRNTALAFAILTSDESTSEVIDRQVADDWQCEQPSPVVAATWWGSYLGYTDAPCECNDLAEPVRPDYFLLSIWSDVPAVQLGKVSTFSHPGQQLWQYRAYQYDEVQVGSDGQPLVSRVGVGREPVFRYAVTIPAGRQFTPDPGAIYWFSVVAVYRYPGVAKYPWGWTNHVHTFNDSAVAGSEATSASGKNVWTWQPLSDGSSADVDMSFILFQQAQILGPPPQLP